MFVTEAFGSLSQVAEQDGASLEKAKKLEGSVNAVRVSVVAVVVWVVIVTIALVVIGLVSFRKWRRDSFQTTETGSAATLSVASGSDLGDLSSDFGSLGEPTPVPQRRGTQNPGFSADGEDNLSVDGLAPEDQANASVDIADVHIPRSAEVSSL